MISRGPKAKRVRIHHILKTYTAIILYNQILNLAGKVQAESLHFLALQPLHSMFAICAQRHICVAHHSEMICFCLGFVT